MAAKKLSDPLRFFLLTYYVLFNLFVVDVSDLGKYTHRLHLGKLQRVLVQGSQHSSRHLLKTAP